MTGTGATFNDALTIGTKGLTVDGNLLLGAGAFNLDVTLGATAGTISLPTAGTFANAPAGNVVLNGVAFGVSYAAGTGGNDLVPTRPFTNTRYSSPSSTHYPPP